MSKNKEFFHYRNAFKSDHLAKADIEELQENNDGVAILTLIKIEYFEKRKVAGRTKDKGLVAFFKEHDTKPMIVNAHNSKIISKFIGSSNVNDWGSINVPIELYIDKSVQMSGKTVGGIRVKQRQPSLAQKAKPSVSPKRFKIALAKIAAKEYTVEQLKADSTLNEDQKKQLDELR